MARLVWFVQLLAAARLAAAMPADTSAVPALFARQNDTPTATCATEACFLDIPTGHYIVWRTFTPTETVVAATVRVIVNKASNATTTTTVYNTLPAGVEMPPTNEAGTRVALLTSFAATGGVATVAYPTQWADYDSIVNWWGTHSTKSTCTTVPRSENKTITLPPHSPIPTTELSDGTITVPVTDSEDPRGLFYQPSFVSYRAPLASYATQLDEMALATCFGEFVSPPKALSGVRFLTETETVVDSSTPTPTPEPPVLSSSVPAIPVETPTPTPSPPPSEPSPPAPPQQQSSAPPPPANTQVPEPPENNPPENNPPENNPPTNNPPTNNPPTNNPPTNNPPTNNPPTNNPPTNNPPTNNPPTNNPPTNNPPTNNPPENNPPTNTPPNTNPPTNNPPQNNPPQNNPPQNNPSPNTNPTDTPSNNNPNPNPNTPNPNSPPSNQNNPPANQPQAPAPTEQPVVIIGSETFTPAGSSQPSVFVAGSQTLTPGGTVTLAGTTVELNPTAPVVVINGETSSIATQTVTPPAATGPTANSTGGVQEFTGDASSKWGADEHVWMLVPGLMLGVVIHLL